MSELLKLTIPATIYRSHAERDWSLVGAAVLSDELGELTVQQYYEPVTFHIPGGNYTPDFLHVCESGLGIIVEVKDCRYLQSYRDSRAKLRACAEYYPFFIYVMVNRKEGWKVD